jgi:hypothetical protein
MKLKFVNKNSKLGLNLFHNMKFLFKYRILHVDEDECL